MSSTTTLGQLIRKDREARRMTQEDLGFRVGVSQGTISKWERDNNERPTLDKLREIAVVLGSDVNDYFRAVFDANMRVGAPNPLLEDRELAKIIGLDNDATYEDLLQLSHQYRAMRDYRRELEKRRRAGENLGAARRH